MADPPTDYNICPSCGTEFGADDVDLSYVELRMEWVRRGAPWFSRVTEPPVGWNAIAQLISAGFWPVTAVSYAQAESAMRVTSSSARQPRYEVKAVGTIAA